MKNEAVTMVKVDNNAKRQQEIQICPLICSHVQTLDIETNAIHSACLCYHCFPPPARPSSVSSEVKGQYLPKTSPTNL